MKRTRVALLTVAALCASSSAPALLPVQGSAAHRSPGGWRSSRRKKTGAATAEDLRVLVESTATGDADIRAAADSRAGAARTPRRHHLPPASCPPVGALRRRRGGERPCTGLQRRAARGFLDPPTRFRWRWKRWQPHPGLTPSIGRSAGFPTRLSIKCGPRKKSCAQGSSCRIHPHRRRVVRSRSPASTVNCHRSAKKRSSGFASLPAVAASAR